MIDKLSELLQRGEGTNVEYKTCTEQISESLYETVCSFLNHSGGQIVLGVNDGGEIVGVNPKKAEKLKANIITCLKNQELFLPCPYITPQIIEAGEKTIILLDVPCGQYVYRYKGRYWDRNGEADIDVTDQVELLLSLFERKNPHLFEERTVEGLTMEHLDKATFQYCRNILSVIKPEHAWIQLSDEDILVHSRLAKRDTSSNSMNPLLTRVFHELSFVEDMGSGARNIMRYAPLYYPNYKVEINNGTQFVFSITYMEMSLKESENVTKKEKMSPKEDKNVTKKEMMPQEMSPKDMVDLSEEELNLNLDETKATKKSIAKKHKRQQGIIGLIRLNPTISIEEMADRLGVTKRTILRDIEEMEKVVEHTGPARGGAWKITESTSFRDKD